MEEKLKQIINHYGVMPQLKYIHSEYFELDEAIMNYEWVKYVNDNKQHIAEEIADIMVMLKQFQYYYEISDKQIEDIMNFKIDRQLDRIANE
jgi:NTP pyrophosphatase (non-canonical NTP hydrolase)